MVHLSFFNSTLTLNFAGSRSQTSHERPEEAIERASGSAASVGAGQGCQDEPDGRGSEKPQGVPSPQETQSESPDFQFRATPFRRIIHSILHFCVL